MAAPLLELLALVLFNVGTGLGELDIDMTGCDTSI